LNDPTSRPIGPRRLSPVQRARLIFARSTLGLRCAPPQALCCRPLRGSETHRRHETFSALNHVPVCLTDSRLRHILLIDDQRRLPRTVSLLSQFAQMIYPRLCCLLVCLLSSSDSRVCSSAPARSNSPICSAAMESNSSNSACELRLRKFVRARSERYESRLRAASSPSILDSSVWLLVLLFCCKAAMCSASFNAARGWFCFRYRRTICSSGSSSRKANDSQAVELRSAISALVKLLNESASRPLSFRATRGD